MILEILQHRLFHGMFALRMFWEGQLQLLALPFMTAVLFGLYGLVLQLGWKRGYREAKMAEAKIFVRTYMRDGETWSMTCDRLSSLSPPS